MFTLLKNHSKKVGLALLVFSVWFAYCLPDPLFTSPESVVLLDRNGELLAARIASDEQWRFPAGDSLPERFITALIAFEDRTFYDHFGVSPKALARATRQNLHAGRIVSGGSTLSMQVVRLSRNNPERSFIEKLGEAFRAMRLELGYSKAEILRLYATHAPMGGNVVGVEAAAWRYFKRSPHQLSWAEAATLAVLPNAPGLIHPGKNRQALREKRDRLLNYLHETNHFDAITLELSLQEPLPEAPQPLPQHALHLLHYLKKKYPNQSRFSTTLDRQLQAAAEERLNIHSALLQTNFVHNAAALITDAKTGEVVVYVGNSLGDGNGHDVDIIHAPRSPGSSLKPFLFAALLDEGKQTPHQWARDVPVNLNGFTPKNFSETYNGVVPASEALARSLNIPAVLGLKDYGIGPFMEKLKQLGFCHMNQPAEHYGLSLILGGSETTLWELVNAWSICTRTLLGFQQNSGRYPDQVPAITVSPTSAEGENPTFNRQQANLISAGSIYATFAALEQVRRPDDVAGWEYMSSTQPIAWKTGTSFGFRDAWAVGATPNYIVGVWTGNADGTGRPGVIGTRSSAPLMFQLFDLLPAAGRFTPPFDDLAEIAICTETGCKAGRYCTTTERQWVPLSCKSADACSYHKPVLWNRTSGLRVTPLCNQPAEEVAWLVVPPVEAWYYRKHRPAYRPVPAYAPDCSGESTYTGLAVVYPTEGTTLTPTRDFDGNTMPIVAESVCHTNSAVVHWHLNETYLGSTREVHQMPLKPNTDGEHVLRIVDEDGNTHQVSFTVKKKFL